MRALYQFYRCRSGLSQPELQQLFVCLRPARTAIAVVEQAPGMGGEKPLALVVELPGGARLEIGDVKQVPLAAALLHSLHQPC
jgi:hypothetical protein